MPCLLHLYLLCFGELSVLFMFFVACSVHVCCLCLIYSVCVKYALVSYLLIYVFHGMLCLCLLSASCLFRLYLLCLGKLFAHLRFLWYVLSTSVVCASSVLFLSVVLGLSAPFVSSMACFICVYYLCLVRSICFRSICVYCLCLIRLICFFSVCVFWGLFRLCPHFYHFHCKLHKIIMTYFINHRKADNFQMSMFLMTYLLSMPHLLCLRLLYLC